MQFATCIFFTLIQTNDNGQKKTHSHRSTDVITRCIKDNGIIINNQSILESREPSACILVRIYRNPAEGIFLSASRSDLRRNAFNTHYTISSQHRYTFRRSHIVFSAAPSIPHFTISVALHHQCRTPRSVSLFGTTRWCSELGSGIVPNLTRPDDDR